MLGTLAVFASEPGRFGAEQAATLAALADLATIAIHNAELINELGRSREETARRAETERTLREIAARVTSIRDPEAILGLIVDETRRVLGSDGAHLTRMSEDRAFLRPVVISGGWRGDGQVGIAVRSPDMAGATAAPARAAVTLARSHESTPAWGAALAICEPCSPAKACHQSYSSIHHLWTITVGRSESANH